MIGFVTSLGHRHWARRGQSLPVARKTPGSSSGNHSAIMQITCGNIGALLNFVKEFTKMK